MTRLIMPLIAFSICMASPGSDLQKLVDKAVADGESSLKLPRATYRMDSSLKLSGIRNFELDGDGSAIVMTKEVRCMEIKNCSNLSVKNLRIDYDPLPWTQGTVVAVDVANKTSTVKIHAGYPQPARQENINMFIFDPASRSFKRGTKDFYGNRLLPSDVQGEIKIWTHFVPDDVKPGDFAALSWRGDNAVMFVQFTSGLSLENIAIDAAPTLTVVGRENYGTHRFKKLRIMPGETLPPGASEKRLLSSAGDGVNYANGPCRVEMENCEFGFIGDDSVNLHGTALAYWKTSSPNVFAAVFPHGTAFDQVLPASMTLRALAPENNDVIGEYPVQSLRRIADAKVPPEDLKRLFNANSSYWKKGDNPVFEIAVRGTPPELPAGAYLEIKEMNGAGFSIKNCYFHDHRAHGLRIQASNGVIEGNVFERIKGSAIVFGAEYFYWNEAGHVENLRIANNEIRDVCLCPSQFPFNMAAISSNNRKRDKDAPFPANGDRNVAIEGNSIEDCPLPGMLLYALRDSSVRRNVLRNVLTAGVSTLPEESQFRWAPIARGPQLINCIVEGNEIQ